RRGRKRTKRIWEKRIGGVSPGLGAKNPSRGYPRGEAPMKTVLAARECFISAASSIGANCQASDVDPGGNGPAKRLALDTGGRLPYLQGAVACPHPGRRRRHRALHAGTGPAVHPGPQGAALEAAIAGSNGPCCPPNGPPSGLIDGFRTFSASSIRSSRPRWRGR